MQHTLRTYFLIVRKYNKLCKKYFQLWSSRLYVSIGMYNINVNAANIEVIAWQEI